MSLEVFIDNISSDSISLILTPDTEEKNLFLNPTSVGFIQARPPYFFNHTTSVTEGYLIVLTVSGTGLLQFNEAEYQLEANSVVFIPCDKEYHFSASNSDYRWRFMYMNFNGRQAREYYNYIMKNKVTIGMLESTGTIMASLWQVINRYRQYSNEPFAGLNTFANIIEILIEIAELNSPVPYYNLACPTHIKEIFGYIELNYTQKITLSILEKKFSISKYYIARQFKIYSGVTINEYIILKRLNRAKSLLKHTDNSISVIAEEIGFYDAGHFINQFKAREHVTPHAYRKAVKN